MNFAETNKCSNISSSIKILGAKFDFNSAIPLFDYEIADSDPRKQKFQEKVMKAMLMKGDVENHDEQSMNMMESILSPVENTMIRLLEVLRKI
jgi:hypothetical protein